MRRTFRPGMLRGAAIVAVFLAAAGALRSADDVPFVARLDKTEQRYVVVRPKGFDAALANTAVVALHGHGSDRWQFVTQDRGECKGTRDVAAAHGFLLVCLDYRAKTSWMGPAAEADVLQILDELRAKYGVRRVVVAGGSMGGTAALAFAALLPDQVAGCASLNGSANVVEYEGSFARRMSST
ncbi:alpha/beta hydrolase family protein [Urbifossiella limnaea]|uniref:Homoserine O-acetyltransferase n=1 Tax=Urbifossiella limnaea TaxID=2528023 RepID=A0A517XND9_9BACT|nr:alpha/beta fold hydrolase [Urbifossiella limnaea]QDU19019.1 Homoserine O-acetyltransferase [Urbifossiella limnaea]